MSPNARAHTKLRNTVKDGHQIVAPLWSVFSHLIQPTLGCFLTPEVRWIFPMISRPFLHQKLIDLNWFYLTSYLTQRLLVWDEPSNPARSGLGDALHECLLRRQDVCDLHSEARREHSLELDSFFLPASWQLETDTERRHLIGKLPVPLEVARIRGRKNRPRERAKKEGNIGQNCGNHLFSLSLGLCVVPDSFLQRVEKLVSLDILSLDCIEPVWPVASRKSLLAAS